MWPWRHEASSHWGWSLVTLPLVTRRPGARGHPGPAPTGHLTTCPGDQGGGYHWSVVPAEDMWGVARCALGPGASLVATGGRVSCYWSCQAATTRPIYGQGHWGTHGYDILAYSILWISTENTLTWVKSKSKLTRLTLQTRTSDLG